MHLQRLLQVLKFKKKQLVYQDAIAFKWVPSERSNQKILANCYSNITIQQCLYLLISLRFYPKTGKSILRNVHPMGI
jgi:hypothetical protein